MRVLVIAAHPDDETLGCGGTLLKHVAAGDDVGWLVVTRVHEPHWSRDTAAVKSAEIEAVADALGVREFKQLGFPAAYLDRVAIEEIIDSIRETVAQVRPDTVYVVHGGDLHTDHRIVYAAAMSGVKPFSTGQHGVKRVLCYETLSSTDAAPPVHAMPFRPNVHSDISAYIDRKLQIMDLYKSEAQGPLLPRGASAIRALARYRGATIGVEYAEALMLVRELF